MNYKKMHYVDANSLPAVTLYNQTKHSEFKNTCWGGNTTNTEELNPRAADEKVVTADRDMDHFITPNTK